MRANLSMYEWQAATTGPDAANAEGVGDSCPDARLDLQGIPEDRWKAAKGPLSDPQSGGCDEVAEHLGSVLTSVVAPRPLVQVALKPLVRDGVVSATHPTLEQAEEAVDGLRVRPRLRRRGPCA
jgi:hypothetical protein